MVYDSFLFYGFCSIISDLLDVWLPGLIIGFSLSSAGLV
jgi:hypothetical protein